MKSKLINYFFIPLCSAVLSIIIGTIFSFVTGYIANNVHLILKLLVWLINIIISYSLSFLFFIKCKEVKFFNNKSILLTIFASGCLVGLISGDLQCLYLAIPITVFSIWEIVEKILKHKK